MPACVAGEGAYVAEKVGRESFANHTSVEARAYHFSASPLQKNINLLIRILTYTAVALCALPRALLRARRARRRP